VTAADWSVEATPINENVPSLLLRLLSLNVSFGIKHASDLRDKDC